MLITLDCYQELFWFATGHVICNDDIDDDDDDDAVKFTEGEENDCYHL